MPKSPHLGEGLLARTLLRAEWTHEAHLAATTYLLIRRSDIAIDEALPGIIRAYNESVGGFSMRRRCWWACARPWPSLWSSSASAWPGVDTALDVERGMNRLRSRLTAAPSMPTEN